MNSPTPFGKPLRILPLISSPRTCLNIPGYLIYAMPPPPPQPLCFLSHQPYTLEPEQFPYPNGVDKPEFGVRFHFFSGNVYRMTPIAGFRPVPPGRSKVIRFVSEHHCVSRTDVHPNWLVYLYVCLSVFLHAPPPLDSGFS